MSRGKISHVSENYLYPLEYYYFFVNFSWLRKFLGLANRKTVTIQPGGKDLSVVLATSKTKKQNNPSISLQKSVMKKEFPRMAKAVVNQVLVFLENQKFS